MLVHPRRIFFGDCDDKSALETNFVVVVVVDLVFGVFLFFSFRFVVHRMCLVNLWQRGKL